MTRAGLVEARAIRWLGLTSIVLVAACGDVSNPTGPTPRSTPSFAAGKGSIVQSITGLEPLLDAVFNESEAFDVSDFGVVVGTSRTSVALTHAVVWDGNTIPQDLGALDTHSGATAIAPNGSIIVGFGVLGVSQHAVRWVRVSGTWVIDALPDLPGADSCTARDVASNGLIVGTCRVGAGIHAVFWRNGIVTELGLGAAVAVNAKSQILVNRLDGGPEIVDVGTSQMTTIFLGQINNSPTAGTGMNDAGEVAAVIAGGPGFDRPYVWTKKKGYVALPVLDGDMFTTGIDQAGNVLGFTNNVPVSAARTVIWKKNKSYELGVLPSYTGAIALAINPIGQIVGSSYVGSNIRATLWTLR